MTDDTVHQALFGYAKGHRLLASSVALPPAANRLLRAASDAAVEANTRYLAVLPVTELRAQAFIRTWPAESWIRPGSVWSHVLMVDFVTLADLTSLREVTGLFRRPLLRDGESGPALEPYERPLGLRDGANGHDGLPAGTTPRDLSDDHPFVDARLAEQVLAGVYGSDERALVQVQDAADAETTLLAVMEQQWPRLRRQYSFRTRLRPSDGSSPYDLEVVERARLPRSISSDAPWIPPLLADLEVPGGGELRAFLRRFGPESAQGRRDLPLLVRVHGLFRDDAAAAVMDVCGFFPKPEQMAGLKRALLGPAGDGTWSPPGWPRSDAERLRLLFAAPYQALDYDDLWVGDRLGKAIRSVPADAAAALDVLDLEALSPRHVEILVAAIVDNSDESGVLSVASGQPDLGLLLVARRPTLLGEPAIWDLVDHNLLVDIFRQASEDTRKRSLRALVRSAAIGPLVFLCNASPSFWWDALFLFSADKAPPERLVANGDVLRTVLSRVGAAAIGTPDHPPRSDREMLSVLVCADLSAGLWRLAPASDWLRLNAAKPLIRGLPQPLKDRLPAVALLASVASGDRQTRVDAWLETFHDLHKALARTDFDPEAWAALSSALPAAPDWDRCLRLRRGAVGEISRDRWNDVDADALLAGSGTHRSAMMDELKASEGNKKKNKHWLRQLVDLLSP